MAKQNEINGLQQQFQQKADTRNYGIIGVIFVVVFVSVSGSFKNMIISQITGSMLGDIQIHRKGYVASIENLPLTLMMSPQQVEKADGAIKTISEIEAYSPRVKFGGLFSNFVETTNIRLNGVDPDMEMKTLPRPLSTGQKTPTTRNSPSRGM